MTISETVTWFNSLFELNKGIHDTKKDFYCGITNDINRREEEHNVKEYIGYTHCDSFDTARILESRLGDEGYDIGSQAGNGQEDSLYVYMYRKIAGVTKP
jgi:hypothetical protein